MAQRNDSSLLSRIDSTVKDLFIQIRYLVSKSDSLHESVSDLSERVANIEITAPGGNAIKPRWGR